MHIAILTSFVNPIGWLLVQPLPQIGVYDAVDAN